MVRMLLVTITSDLVELFYANGPGGLFAFSLTRQHASFNFGKFEL